MENLTTIEDTLFVPVMGRIYASEQFPHILKDQKALELKDRLPDHLKNKQVQNQYAALSGAVRSANIDRYVRAFLKRNPKGIVAELNCGLETTCFRCDNGQATWYEIDMPDIIEYRKSLMRETDRIHFFAGNGFACQWLEQIRAAEPAVPVLVLAAGILNYFPHEKILKLMRRIQSFGSVEILFDTVNHRGMQRMASYMKQNGTEHTEDLFCVDDAAVLAREIGGSAAVTLEDTYFSHVDFSKVGFLARSSMRKAEKAGLMKMVGLKLSGSGRFCPQI